MPEFDEIMTTTFAARRFTSDAVSDQEIAEILDLARFAPSGGNRQGWRVVVVREPATKQALVEAGMPAIRRYVAERSAGLNPMNTVVPSAITDDEVAAVTEEQLDWFRETAAAPVLLVVGVDLSVVASFDADLDRVGVVSGASVYPFVHNILLAARSRGLGGALTTYAAAAEPEVQRLVGFPSHVAMAALVPLGRPVTALTRLTRRPVAAFARFERWDGRPVEHVRDRD